MRTPPLRMGLREDSAILQVLALVALMLSVALPSAASECHATPAESLLPSVVAPMAGAHPVWAVGGGSDGGGWCCPDCAIKILWVVARDERGDLTIHGHRLDGSAHAEFRSGGRHRSGELRIADAHTAPGVLPGGAPAEVLDRYAFFPSHVFYSEPGCWEMVARYGTSEVRIVQKLPDESHAPWCHRLLQELDGDSQPGDVDLVTQR